MTWMEKETREAPRSIEKQLKENAPLLREFAKWLKKSPPLFAVTAARGSSGQAGLFLKYLLETHGGIITTTAAPSVFTLYKAKLNWKNSLMIGISQSGESPDICEVLQKARKGGAMTVAFVNQTQSPLAELAHLVVPLWAGKERAVAATKTFLASLASLLQFTAYFSEDPKLLSALTKLPEVLYTALEMDWSCAVPHLTKATDIFVIGRGFGFPIAREAALKLKETSNLHAEAYSGAEVMHGPFALVKKEFPLLFFMQKDATLRSLLEVVKKANSCKAKTILALPQDLVRSTQSLGKILLPLPKSLHPAYDPLIAIQAFYLLAEKLAKARGLNPDQPQHLKKVTRTV